MALGSSAGMVRQSWGGGVLDYAGKRPKSPLEEMYQLYNAGVEKQAGDYDEIMGKFRDVYGRSMGPEGNFTPIGYDKSTDTTAALANLNELSRTGGISGADEQNLRARGISPIRAMYATAQRDMDRNRRLQGGYSPNYGAVTAKMTRDQSSMIGDQMNKVNANIAEMRQSGRLSAAPNYASAAQAESELKHGIAKFNAQGLFDASRQKRSEALGAAQGMSNLYGTTPALANLYGTQAMNTAQFQAGEQQRKTQNKIGALGRMYSA